MAFYGDLSTVTGEGRIMPLLALQGVASGCIEVERGCPGCLMVDAGRRAGICMALDMWEAG